MQQKYFIGVDIGTTSTKAVVFTPQSRGIGNREYSIWCQKPAWRSKIQRSSSAVISTTRGAIEQAGVAKREIAGVGFSAAHGLSLWMQTDIG